MPQIFKNIAILWYAQDRRIRQLQSKNNCLNRLAFPNKDRIFLEGLNAAFLEISAGISDRWAFSLLNSVPGILATDFLRVENILGILSYVQARRIRQLQNQNKLSNRLAFTNKD